MNRESRGELVSNKEFEAARAKREVKPLTEAEKLKNQVRGAFKKLEGVDKGYKDLIERLENPKPEYAQGNQAPETVSQPQESPPVALPEPVAVKSSFPEILPMDSVELNEFLNSQEIMERSQRGRELIFAEHLADIGDLIDEHTPQHIKSLVSMGANYFGFAGTVKMGIEAGAGQTADGKKLKVLGRINHLVIQGLFLAAWRLGWQGDYESAGTAYTASWIADGIQYYPEIITSLVDWANKKGKTGIAAKLDKIRSALDKAGVRDLFFKSDKAEEK